MKKIKSISIAIIMIVLGISAFRPFNVLANASISGPGNVSVGDTFSVTVSVPNSKAWAYNISVNGPGEAVGGTFDVTGFEGSSLSNTVSIRATGPGTITISANGEYSSDGTTASVISNSTSVSVVNPNTGGNENNNGGGNTAQPPVDNGQPAPEQKPVEEKKEEAPEKKDSNTRLKSLSVDKGTLSPEFSANEKKYNLILPKDTTEIDVVAEAEAATSKVEISGNKELKVGSNLVIVKVTAEDESFAHYEITAVVDEDPSVFLNFGSMKLGVVVNAGDILVQEGYEETIIKVDGKEIKSYKNTFNDRTLLYLSDEKGNRAFYLYDVEKNEVIGKVTFIGLSGKNYGHIELDETKHERPGMIYGEVEIEKNKLMGWKYEDEALKDFSHVYLMNESGQLNYYQYEATEQSIQIYHDGISDTSATGSNVMTFVAVGLGVLAVAGISLSAYFWISNKKLNEVIFRREQREKTVDEDINDEKED